MQITEEQKKAASDTDLVYYLESKGYEFKRTGHKILSSESANIKFE